MRLQTTKMLVLGLALVGFCVGCSDDQQNNIKDKSDEIGEKFKNTSNEARDSAAEKLEAEIVDYLTCAGVARPSTLKSIADVLKDKDLIKLNDLLMAPENAAQLVGIAGVTVEGSVLLLQNLKLLAEQGHLEDVVSGKFDALTCGDELTLSCTAGTGTTTVACDDNDEVTSVKSSYAGCVLKGAVYQGDVVTTIDPADKTQVRFDFDGLTIDEVTAYKGPLIVKVDVGDSGQVISLDADGESFEKISFGGFDGEFSCGQTLGLSTLSIDRQSGGDIKITVDGNKKTKKETYAFKSFGEHLNWQAEGRCTCPVAGSGFEMTLPKPLGRDNETATLRISFNEGSGACSTPAVEVIGWPSECSKLTESPFSDCGKESVEKLITPLLSAMCQPLE